MTSSANSDATAAVVSRGNGVEAWHAASVAVVDAEGRLTHAFGDPELVTFARSSIKPLQALPLIESGAADAFALGEPEIAVATASHSGTDEHVRVVDALLAKAGVSAADLGCGAHLPIAWRREGRPALNGEDRDPRRNACSGKHAAFLALARWLGEPLAGYLDPERRAQTLVRRAVADACGVPEERLPRGVDGCSAPNYALPLVALARGMLKVALAEPEPNGAGAPRAAALARVRTAMQARPELVSGEGRFDLDLMRAFPGNVVCKTGAEGLELVAFRDPPIALAVKVHDGAERALPPICVAVLSELGLVSSEPPSSLKRHREPAVTNHRRIVTGHVVPRLSLAKL